MYSLLADGQLRSQSLRHLLQAVAVFVYILRSLLRCNLVLCFLSPSSVWTAFSCVVSVSQVQRKGQKEVPGILPFPSVRFWQSWCSVVQVIPED